MCTIRPWVKNGLSLHGLPSPVLTDTPKEKPSPTIRLVDSETSLHTPGTSKPSSTSSTPAAPLVSTPTLTTTTKTSHPISKHDKSTPEHRSSRVTLFGPRDKNYGSPHVTPPTGRARGKTVPFLGNSNSPKTPDSTRTDSALSWTPSTSSKHLTNWISGLLGR